MTHRPLSPQHRDSARNLRREMSDASRRLWSMLRGRRLDGWKFRRESPFGPYILDFVCHEARLAVEIHAEGPERLAHDRFRAEIVEMRGYRILRLRNILILTEPEAARAAVRRALPAGSPPRTAGSPPPQPSPARGEGAARLRRKALE